MINKHLSITWGDKRNGFIPQEIQRMEFNNLQETHPLKHLVKAIQAESVVLNHQVHGIQGHIITNNTDIPSTLLTQEGDFLITHQPSIALGILTADCVPIILYDKKSHVVALIHAGWKGATQGIIEHVIKTLQVTYHTDLNELQISCGPAARGCCYEVQNDFYDILKNNTIAQQCFEKRNNKLFFGLEKYVSLILDKYGIELNQRDFSAYYCTICSPSYYSYRKDKGTKYRNITLVSLK